MEVLTNINKQLEEFKAKRADMVKQIQTEFPNLLTPILSQSKRIESIGWRQYTPYFNDGDECVFGVHNDDLYINGEDEGTVGTEFIQKRIWDGGKYIDNPNLDKFEYDLLQQIEKVLKEIPNDFYKDLFGDHVKVTVYKDGRIEADQYDHD